MNPLLFVYGTLKSSARSRYGRAERARLHHESEIIGPATVPGSLYDLGDYPGLAEASGNGDVVTGELLHLRDPAATLEWLDRYEGIGLPPGSADEYRRIKRPVCTATGEILEAWIYVMHGERAGLPRIASGVWGD